MGEDFVDQLLNEIGVDQNQRGVSPTQTSMQERELDDEERLQTPDALQASHNSSSINEQPWHRAALWMLVRGAKVKDVAATFGKTPQSVTLLKAQPWFKKQVALALKEISRTNVQELLDAEIGNSLATLVELRDDAEAPPATRKSAADSILDRALGKATVYTAKEETPDMTAASEEFDKLRKEYEDNQRKLNAGGIN